MKNPYVFRRIAAGEVPQVFALILDRIKWMDQQGIRQWNTTDYASVYPLSYYEAMCREGLLFVLAEESSGEIVSAAVLKEQDDRWADDAPAVYLHNFVSRIGVPGAGSQFLQYTEEAARSAGKLYFRLDSAVSNEALGQYYESHGFLPAGTCEDGPYRGTLRQKALR